MARTALLGTDRGNRFYVAPQTHVAHEALQKKMEECLKAGKMTKDDLTEMKALLATGQTYISYERLAHKDEGRGYDETKPLATLQYGALWIGHPEAEGSSVLISNRAIRGSGDQGNFNAIVEDRVVNGRTYSNTVGVRFSEWARKQDQAEYEKWAKDNKIVLPNSQTKPKGEVPVGSKVGKDEVPFSG